MRGQQVLLLSFVEMMRANRRKSPGKRHYHAAPHGKHWIRWAKASSLPIHMAMFEYVNRAAEQMLAISITDALGKPFAELINLVDEGDRHPLADPVKQCLTSGSRG